MACEGYPAAAVTGAEVVIPAELPNDSMLFHAGTAHAEDGRLVTSGGRVLAVTGTGDTVAEARERSLALVGQIHFPGAQWRTDIGGNA
jgi:phosphoribosylamine--glycine ligase